MKLYKVLDHYQSCTAGSFDWTIYLPYNGHSGEWTPIVKNPAICERGYHGTDAEHLIQFTHGNQLFEVEAEGIIWSENGEKFTSQSMRLVRQVPEWNDHTLRLFAVWCARDVLSHLWNPYPEGEHACDIAEKFANGEASEKELADAQEMPLYPKSNIAWSVSKVTLDLPAWRAARGVVWASITELPARLLKNKLLEMLGLKQVIP